MDMFQFGFEDLESQLETDVFDDEFDADELYRETPYTKKANY